MVKGANFTRLLAGLRPFQVAAAVVLLVTMVACGPQGSLPAAPRGAAPPVADTAAQGPVEPIKIKFLTGPSVGGGFIPPFVARDAGFFRKYGLDVEIESLGGQAKQVQAMATGQGQFSSSAGADAVNAVMGGMDVVLIAQHMKGLVYFIVSAPEIKSPADLKGKTFGVTRIGDTNHFSATYVLKRWGLKPDEDVTIVQMGAQRELIAGLVAGAVQAAGVNVGGYTVAAKEGMNLLQSMADLNVDYLSLGVATTRTYIRENRDVVLRFMKAWIEATDYAYKNKDATLKVMQDYMRLDDPEALENTYTYFTEKILQRIPFPTESGVKTVLEEVAITKPEVMARNPKEFIDPGPMEELERSGFLKAFRGQ